MHGESGEDGGKGERDWLESGILRFVGESGVGEESRVSLMVLKAVILVVDVCHTPFTRGYATRATGIDGR